MFYCRLTSLPSPIFRLHTSRFFPMAESLLMGLESLWEFLSEGLQSHQAGLVWSSLVVQIPIFAGALHNAETYRKIPTWALAPGSLCEVASLSLLFPHKPDHTLQQMSYSAMGREEGEGCLYPYICLPRFLYHSHLCVSFSDPLTWDVWKHRPFPFTGAENTVWPHAFYFRI